MAFRKATVEVLRDLIAEMQPYGHIEEIIDNEDGTYNIKVCEPLWVRPYTIITIDEIEFTVDNVIYGDCIEFVVTSDVAPVGDTYYIDAPFYFHGTPVMAGAELARIINSNDKTPMIYAYEVIEDEMNYDESSNSDRVSNLRLFFLDQCNYEDWDTEQHYSGAITPMMQLCDYFVNFCRNHSGIGEILLSTSRYHANFQINLNTNGHLESLFPENLSGVECEFDFPISVDLGCPCGACRTIDDSGNVDTSTPFICGVTISDSDTVVISGANFINVESITWGGGSVTSYVVNSANEITANLSITGSDGYYSMTVTTVTGTITKNNALYVYSGAIYTPSYPDPTICSVAKVDSDTITITGSNFDSVTSVIFTGGTVSSYTVDSETQITANLSVSTTNGNKNITVNTLSGSATKTNAVYVYSNIPYIISVPAPFIGSVSVSELPKSLASQTVVIYGSNFVDVLSVTFTGGTVTTYNVDSTTQITATITTNTTSGYTNITVLTTAGTYTLSSCIRMYTRVIPGTDVSWLDITGTVTTGAGFIRTTASGTSFGRGAMFLLTTNSTADWEVTYKSDITDWALSNHNGLVGTIATTPNATPSNRYASTMAYLQNTSPDTCTWVNQKTASYFFYNNNFTLSTSTVYRLKRLSSYLFMGIDGKDHFSPRYIESGTIYIDFTPYYRCGYKDIVGKVYD